MTAPPNAVQRFEVARVKRRRIRVGEVLVNNQTESAGADESTTPSHRALGPVFKIPLSPRFKYSRRNLDPGSEMLFIGIAIQASRRLGH
jgi:hypothetical protein